MPTKPKRKAPKPRPRPNRELDSAKAAAKTILGNRLRARSQEEAQRKMQTLIEEAIEDQAARERQKRTGKDKYGVQRGRRTAKLSKGQGI